MQVNIKKKVSISLSYKLDNSLLYLIKYNNRRHLCILNILVENIFKIAYNKIRYCKFNKVFKQLYKLIINKTSCQLQVYIDKCLNYDKN